MGTVIFLADLFRYKKSVDIKDKDGKVATTIWMRIISDADLQDSYKKGRIVSARKRKALHDSDSDEYLDELGVFDVASKEDCIRTIVASKSNNYMAEAMSAIDRDDLPTLREIASDPDAPTLEEQEKLEEEVERREADYQKKLYEHVADKTKELEAELDITSDEELRNMARLEAANVLALTAFLGELKDQKTWRAVYLDEKCATRGFHSVEEFRQVHSDVIDQLREAYAAMEVSPEDLKN